MKKAIIIDGNNVAYASQNSKPLKTGAGEPVQAIYGTLRTIKHIHQTNPGAKVVVLWDSPRDWRTAEYPEYKGERDNTEDLRTMRAELREQRPKIIRSLFYLGVDQISADGFEADDLAWILGSRFEKSGLFVEYRTGDTDWLQLVTENSLWMDPVRERIVTFKSFEDATGAKDWQQFLNMKALKGDKTDNLHGIPGIGEKTATDIVREFGSVARLLSHYDKNGEFEPKSLPTATLNRARKKINAFCSDESLRDAFFFNIRMMDLRNAPKPKRDQIKITKGKYSVDKFTTFCEDHQFKSILNHMDGWTSVFG